MMALVRAEWFKLMRQRRTYWAFGAILLIEALVLLGAYFQGTNIIELLLDNLRKSFYFEGNLLNGNLMVYLLLNTLWFHLPLILMIVVSGMMTNEYKDKTLHALFLQPLSKRPLVLAKYVVAIQFTLMVLLFLAGSAVLFSYVFFGRGDLVVYLDSLNFFTDAVARERIAWAFAFGGLSMVFFTVVSLTLAILIKEAMATWIAASFFLVFTNLLLKIDLGSAFLNRWFFVKLMDSWQYFFLAEIPWSVVGFNALLLLVYTLLVMGLGTYFFMKKDLD
ncbi:MAG: ABC transporter permease [Sphingobacteriia bacterium]|nr:MAG: ABC transporter permease [Sphingobacteriia bacterium]